MIDFRIEQLFPAFLLADKNGYAMAKAIEAGLRYYLSAVQTGLDTLQNVDKMPEWRLDEMAQELNCLYDYNADIEAKRRWIKDATPLFYSYGTPKAIYNFLEGFFDQVELEEYWQYGGEPFHFRVTVSGEWTDANEAWLRRAVAAAKNVRSVLDDIAVGSGTTIVVRGEGAILSRFPYAMTGPDRLTGTEPVESIIARIVEADLNISAADTRGYTFPYPMAGTKPQENTVGAASDIVTETASDGKATAFSYSPCTDENLCGSDEI